jgi:pyruvate,orthophosphate dikinase
LPVPPGFTICTEACRLFLRDVWPDGLDDEIRLQMDRIGETVGRRFGDPEDPLLVSVRSGAPVSMPGMMDTILNLGLNDDTTRGLAAVTGDRRFAEACRGRFVAMYRAIVGVEEVPEDPWEQLRGAVEAVFGSWNRPRARSYRAHEGIDDELGTAVTVQTMVFGNRGADSATGVVFTRNPATGEAVLYGDLLFDAQGEDVVAGTHMTEPISALDQRMPKVAEELRRYADLLERHYADVCDIEFTIEQGRLWLLQTRIGKRSPLAALRIAVDMAEDEDFPLTRAEAVRRVAPLLLDPPRTLAERNDDVPMIARGLGASPGIASGRIATTPEAAIRMAEEGERVILVREQTSPDDVHGIAKASGILTSTGGLVSHAAVVARGWGIPAVVGASTVAIVDDLVRIADRTLTSMDTLSIDGETGEVFVGSIAGEPTVVAEAEKLLAWAGELGIDLGESRERTTAMPPSDGLEAAGVSRDDILRALAIKGFATREALAEIFGVSEERIAPNLDELVADGVVELMGTMFRLTKEGGSLADELMALDREEWGPARAEVALDDFLELDQRMKEIVTSWQTRSVEGEMILNDHSDADYDASVLTGLQKLHDEALEWLVPLCDELGRLESYVSRFRRAAGLVAEGDHQYIASPRLDSYHNIWFELHEDLIRLAGRTREDEVAEGRA